MSDPDFRRTMPSLSVMRSFECAARHQSFTLAARELALTQSAVSRQIKELEDALGVTLFQRVGRRVILTGAGQALAEEIALDLDRIRQTLYRAVAAGSRGSALRIATLPTFGNRWLIPRLPRFEARFPEVEVSFATRLEPFDLSRERFDLAIHFGDDNWPDASLTPLCDEQMIAVASPGLAERLGLADPDALVAAPLLHLTSRSDAWCKWFAMLGRPQSRILPGKQFDQFSMVIAAACSSLGAALVPDYLVEEELRAGQLVRLGSAVLETSNRYFVVRPYGAPSPQTDAFAHWIIAEARQSRLARAPAPIASEVVGGQD